MLGGEHRPRPFLGARLQIRRDGGRDPGEVDEEPVEHVGDLTAGHELFVGELLDRLEQPVALDGAFVVEDHERPFDERGEMVEDPVRVERREAGDGLGGVEREPAAELGQPAQQDPLVVGEELVAPLDRCPQGLVSGESGTASPGQQSEPVLQPVEDAIDRHGAHACRGQLDGERDPVEVVADGRDRRCVVRA